MSLYIPVGFKLFLTQIKKLTEFGHLCCRGVLCVPNVRQENDAHGLLGFSIYEKEQMSLKIHQITLTGSLKANLS